MGLFENNRLSARERERATASVLLLRDAGVGQFARLDRRGQVKTGGERGRRPRDAAWWCPDNGAPSLLWDDWTAFRRGVSARLDRAGLPNPYREHSRAVWAGVLQGATLVVGGALVATGVAAGVGAGVIAGGAAAASGVRSLGDRRASGGDVLRLVGQAGAGAVGVDLELVPEEAPVDLEHGPPPPPDRPRLDVSVVGRLLVVGPVGGLALVEQSRAGQGDLLDAVGEWRRRGGQVTYTDEARAVMRAALTLGET